jgi:alpha-1,3-mannosyltransferase
MESPIFRSKAVMGGQFIAAHPWSYLQRAFEFSRIFTYKWTVNWKFVGEELFVSKPWALSLLMLHLCTLLLFAQWRWMPTRLKPPKFGFLDWVLFPRHPSENIKRNNSGAQWASYVFLVLSSANLVGMTFARSLHYQFYSWYFHTLPFLLWRTRLPLVGRIMIFFIIEWCWNVYPATAESSAILLSAHISLILGLWFSSQPELFLRLK